MRKRINGLSVHLLAELADAGNADGIGPATIAMAEDDKIFLRRGARDIKVAAIRRSDVRQFMLRDQRNNVDHGRAGGFGDTGNFTDMIAVDAGNQNAIDLDDHAVRGKFADAIKLRGDEAPGAFNAAQDAAADSDKTHNLIQNGRINGIDRDSNSANAERGDAIRFFRQAKSIGAEALDKLGILAINEIKSVQSVIRGQRITGAGDTGHGDLGTKFKGQFEFINGLARAEHAAGDARAIFRLIKSAFAETAADVAAGSNGKMNAADGFVRTFAEAWVHAGQVGKLNIIGLVVSNGQLHKKYSERGQELPAMAGSGSSCGVMTI